MKFFPLHSLFPDLPKIHIVDIGASGVDGPPPYQRLLDENSIARLTGFEPNPAECQRLQALAKPDRVYLPFAVGDGNDAVLNVCQAPGMSSLLEPNFELLKHFHGFEGWGRIVDRIPVSTRRLDDLPEIDPVDYLKLDVQGSELAILRGGQRTLAKTLIIHLEMPFVPIYRKQPLFGDLDAFLRSAGFGIHAFSNVYTRALKPIIVKNDICAGLHQLFEADADYVRSFERFGELDAVDLLKIARVAHDVWGSVDLAALALGHVDEKTGSSRQKVYVESIRRDK